MRFASLGSGSKGNALIVSHHGTQLLLDCGLPVRQMETALQRLDLGLESLDAVFVTHEHGDHIRGLKSLLRRRPMPVFMSHGTALAAACTDIADINFVTDRQEVLLGSLAVRAVIVPHDAREPCQYLVREVNEENISRGSRRLGLLTDLGSASAHVVDAFSGCDGLVLECNHDVEMLMQGPYPESVKQRVRGDWGHLSNVQARELLGDLQPERLQWLVLAHLSEKNNCKHLALQEISQVFPQRDKVIVADQQHGFDWLELC
ncbi:MAG: MBL fold metallo-hydrolase [Pseudomonadales bacterium]